MLNKKRLLSIGETALSKKYLLNTLIILLIIVVLKGAFKNEEQKTTQQIETPTTPTVTIQTPEPDAPEPETESETEQFCLALNIYHESRNDNFSGRLAVADVVFNRVESPHFPNKICDVVYQAVERVNWKGNVVAVRGMCQFSWYCDGKSDYPFDEESWQESMFLAGEIMDGDWRGISDGATHYHATYVTPNWVKDRGMVSKGRIGAHKFYKWH